MVEVVIRVEMGRLRRVVSRSGKDDYIVVLVFDDAMRDCEGVSYGAGER